MSISFSCDKGTLVCTALLAVFGWLQWKAVKEQNKQNLFKIRLEYYTKVKKFLTEPFTHFENISCLLIQSEDDIESELIDELSLISNNSGIAIKETRELRYLFGTKMAHYWLSFFTNIRGFTVKLKKERNENDFKNELSMIRLEQTKVISQFNKELNLNNNSFLWLNLLFRRTLWLNPFLRKVFKVFRKQNF